MVNLKKKTESMHMRNEYEKKTIKNEKIPDEMQRPNKTKKKRIERKKWHIYKKSVGLENSGKRTQECEKNEKIIDIIVRNMFYHCFVIFKTYHNLNTEILKKSLNFESFFMFVAV